jgi:integrase
VPNLTDLTVQKLPEGLHFDTKLPSFGIRVGKRRRTWLVIRGTNRTKVTLGHYPALTLAEARKKALGALSSPEQGKPRISYEKAVEAFLALPRWRFHSRRVLQSSLKHFSWKRTLDKITHEDVAQALEAIKAPSARAHALKDIRTFFNWCVPRYLDRSPCDGLRMEKQKSRDRILSADELKAVWYACEGTFGTIVKLLILTGQRKTEIGWLHWSYVGQDTIVLPPEVTKNGREHTFPIGKLAKSLLPPKGNGYVFKATDSEERYNGFAFHHAQLLKASKTSGWTLHDLRRTFVSIHAELGTPIHVAEKLVNHVSGTFGGVRGIYDRYTYLEEMRAACERYEAHISSLVS